MKDFSPSERVFATGALCVVMRVLSPSIMEGRLVDVRVLADLVLVVESADQFAEVSDTSPIGEPLSPSGRGWSVSPRSSATAR